MSNNSIADSSAVSLAKRVLPQHQAAISMLDPILTDYQSKDPFDWLDVACGRGQIIAHLDDAIPDAEKRGRLRYFGFDVNNEYAREAERRGQELKLNHAEVKVGQLSDFATLISVNQKFSFITFTNAIHELPPVLVGALLVELVLRLKPGGTLYIYDMETLPEPELGALPWEANEMWALLKFIFKEIGATKTPPAPQRWPHSSCFAWSVTLQRDKLDVGPETLASQLFDLHAKTEQFIKGLFVSKLKKTVEQLEELTEHGTEETNQEEHRRKLNLLFDYWSLSRL